MRAHEILLEYDQRKTIDNYREAILERLRNNAAPDIEELWSRYDLPKPDREAGFLTLLLAGVWLPETVRDDPTIMALSKSVQDWAVKKIVEMCEEHDPTSKKAFVPHILRWWVIGYGQGGLRRLEDLSRVTEPLKTYVKFKNRLSGINLKTITFRKFEEIMDETAQVPSGSEEDKAIERGFYERGEAELLLNDDQIKVVTPKTMEAAQYFGKNTKWCTSAKTDNRFASYNRHGPLYIILFKEHNVRWQFHFDRGEYMDEADDDVLFRIPKVMGEYPQLRKWWDETHRKRMENEVHRKRMGTMAASPMAAALESARNILYMLEPTMDDWRKAAKISKKVVSWAKRDDASWAYEKFRPTPEQWDELLK